MNILKPLLLLSLVLFSTLIYAKQGTPSFSPIDNPKAYIEQEFSLAVEQNKRVMFVLGGNWCHDSRSIAEKLKDSSLSDTIAEHYRVSMIDVGFLEQGFEFTKLANMTTFYATPTVLIFDANTRRLINANDLHQWANAYKISQSDTTQYFKQYAASSGAAAASLLELNPTDEKLVRLNEFRELQEQRIKLGFSIVGPLLKAYKENKDPENFNAYWDELSELRMQLPADLKMLRAAILTEPNQPLVFPSYPKLSWE